MMPRRGAWRGGYQRPEAQPSGAASCRVGEGGPAGTRGRVLLASAGLRRWLTGTGRTRAGGGGYCGLPHRGCARPVSGGGITHGRRPARRRYRRTPSGRSPSCTAYGVVRSQRKREKVLGIWLRQVELKGAWDCGSMMDRSGRHSGACRSFFGAPGFPTPTPDRVGRNAGPVAESLARGCGLATASVTKQGWWGMFVGAMSVGQRAWHGCSAGHCSTAHATDRKTTTRQSEAPTTKSRKRSAGAPKTVAGRTAGRPRSLRTIATVPGRGRVRTTHGGKCHASFFVCQTITMGVAFLRVWNKGVM